MTQEVSFRPSQQRIINYRRGKMGVSAVPGSGKTFTLSHLAARLVARLGERGLTDEQEVLIVTFSNSAVNSIKARVAGILQAERMLMAYVGYRVRTLHGLAHDIVRERPSLVGLAEDFQIIDERAAAAIRKDIVEAWVRAYGNLLLGLYINPEVESSPKSAHRIRHDDWPALALSIAENFIRAAKDRRLSPGELRAKLEAAGAAEPESEKFPLARFGTEVYEQYQRSLAYRGAVDFEDLVRLALLALDQDPAYLKRLQKRYRYILEDEAQDSSKLQEDLLLRLSGGKNWIRVGDPNQAINTTFTNADPRFLRAFLLESDVTPHTLPEAGRSVRPIIDLANALVRWTTDAHPVPELRGTFLRQDIQPAPPGDTQGNPADEEAFVYIYYKPNEKITPDRELEVVADSLVNWVAENPDKTVAALVPENAHGFRLAEMLKERGVKYEELLRSTTSTRDAAQRLRGVLDFLAAPATPGAGEKLARLYRDLWWPRHLGAEGDPRAKTWQQAAVEALQECKAIESFLWPVPGESPVEALTTLKLDGDAAPLYADLEAFRRLIMRWLSAAILPIDQLVLTIGADLFTEAPDIALGYKLAQLLRGFGLNNQEARLPEFVEELRIISENQRRFLGFDDAEMGYSPTPGKVTVATMHAAKGLEWDRVYLLSVNNYSFPSALDEDRYLGEKWYIRGRMNLEAEVLAQLEALADDDEYREGEATRYFRIDYAAERLRLLYVGITRAKRELIITWNMGRFYQNADQQQTPALPLMALWEYVSGTMKV